MKEKDICAHSGKQVWLRSVIHVGQNCGHWAPGTNKGPLELRPWLGEGHTQLPFREAPSEIIFFTHHVLPSPPLHQNRDSALIGLGWGLGMLGTSSF